MNVWIFADDGCRDLVTTRYLLRLQKKLRTWVCLDVRLVFLSLFSFLFSFILFSFFLLDEVTSFFSLFSYLFILVYSFLLFTFLLSLSSSKFSTVNVLSFFPYYEIRSYDKCSYSFIVYCYISHFSIVSYSLILRISNVAIFLFFLFLMFYFSDSLLFSL